MGGATQRRTPGLDRILRENGLTEAQMRAEWDDVLAALADGCKAVTVQALVRDGHSWDTLPPHLVPQVPGLADKIRKAEARRQEERLSAEERAERERASRKYYLNHVEEILVGKIDAGEQLSESEIEDFVDELPHFHEIQGEDGRWTRSVTSYLRTSTGRFFRVNWSHGLTESQMDSYWEQPMEVTMSERERTVVVLERTWTEVATGKSETMPVEFLGYGD